MMFMSWRAGNIYELITDGSVAYELIRPMSVYSLWFARNMGLRLSGTLLRCVPVLIFASCLPAPYGIVSARLVTALMFLACVVLHGGQYRDCDYNAQLCNDVLHNVGAGRANTVSTFGRRVYGDLIPLPFMPDAFQRIVKLTAVWLYAGRAAARVQRQYRGAGDADAIGRSGDMADYTRDRGRTADAPRA